MRPRDLLLAALAPDPLDVAACEARLSCRLDSQDVTVPHVEASHAAALELGTRAKSRPGCKASPPARFGSLALHGVRKFDCGGGPYREQARRGGRVPEPVSLIPGPGLARIGDCEPRGHAEVVIAVVNARSYTDVSNPGMRQA